MTDAEQTLITAAVAVARERGRHRPTVPAAFARHVLDSISLDRPDPRHHAGPLFGFTEGESLWLDALWD